MPAFRHPVEGRERAVKLLSRFPDVAPDAKVATLIINGAVAVRIEPVGEIKPVITFVVEDGRIARIYMILNPHKLGRLDKSVELRR